MANAKADRFAVEYREGDSSRHFRVDVAGVSKVVAMFLAYARGDDAAWKLGHAWRQA
jgi:hypothetical protein